MSQEKGSPGIYERNSGNSSTFQNVSTAGSGIIALSENNRSVLPLSYNNVSTTNDRLTERDWEIPCETDDINVSGLLYDILTNSTK